MIEPGAGGTLRLSWSPSCLAAESDYAVYEGTLGSFTDHVPLFCSTSGATAATIVPGGGNTYYLVVPHGGAAEGSYGTASDSLERPPSVAACLPRAMVVCH
jgi:hypothetical protein